MAEIDVLNAIAALSTKIDALPSAADIGDVVEASTDPMYLLLSHVSDDTVAIKTKTDTIGSLDVTVTSPVAASGEVTIYQGDDYDATYGRDLSFAVTDATHALGLDGVGVVVTMKCRQAGWTATAVTSTGTGYTVVFEPAAAETAALTVPRQTYEIEAVLADGDVITLATGTLRTVKDIAPPA